VVARGLMLCEIKPWGTFARCDAGVGNDGAVRTTQGAIRRVAASIVGAIFSFMASAALAENSLKLPDTHLEPVTWTALAGWTADDHLAAFAAYQRSCQALLKRRRTDNDGPMHGALWNVCQKAIGIRPLDRATARAFFEDNFEPVRIARLGEGDGLLTGYFEPVVQGSRFPNCVFHFPLYRRPPDLIAAGYKPGPVAFPNKGRIGRLAHNGYPYSSITRVLIERHLMSRQDMSPQRIRDWMFANPDEAAKVRATNRSYVFFRQQPTPWFSADAARKIRGHRDCEPQ
jgi:membrane-bound lytic murein transglycosylase